MFEYLQEAIDVEFRAIFKKLKRIFQFVNVCVGIENYDVVITIKFFRIRFDQLIE